MWIKVKPVASACEASLKRIDFFVSLTVEQAAKAATTSRLTSHQVLILMLFSLLFFFNFNKLLNPTLLIPVWKIFNLKQGKASYFRGPHEFAVFIVEKILDGQCQANSAFAGQIQTGVQVKKTI